MKKILARFLVLMLCAMLGIGVYATDPTTVPPPDSSIESSDTPEIVVTDDSKFDELLEGLTNSTFWLTTMAGLGAIIGAVAYCKKNFSSISALIKSIVAVISGKATTEDINNVKEGLAVTKAHISTIEQKLDDTNANEKILITMFTIFITNANINPNAKAEIMNYLTGIKDLNGKVADIVETANKIIEEANAAEAKVPTPALDSIVSEGESETPMVLG